MRKERNFTGFASGQFLGLMQYHTPSHPFSFTGPTRYFDRICFWTDPEDSECPTSVFIEGWINTPDGFQQLVDVIEIERPVHNPFE